MTRGLMLAAALLAGCGTPAAAPQPTATSSAVPSAPIAAATPTPVPPGLARQALDGYLRETGRTSLVICLYVDPPTGLQQASSLAALDRTLDVIRREGYTSLPVAPAAACSSAPLFVRTNTVHPKTSGPDRETASPPRTDKPAPHVLVLAVVTPRRITEIFATSSFRRGSEEMMCSGDNCAEVTGSVYLDPDEFRDDSRRLRAVLDGLGLIPPTR